MRLFHRADWILYLFFYAFLAWLIATLYYSLREHRFVNCGALDLPLLLPHGIMMGLLILQSYAGEGGIFQEIFFSWILTLAVGGISDFLSERLWKRKVRRELRFSLLREFRGRLLFSFFLTLLYLSALVVLQPLLFFLLSLLPRILLRTAALLLLLLLLLDFLLIYVVARWGSPETNFLERNKLGLGRRISRRLWERLYRAYPSLKGSSEAGIYGSDRLLLGEGTVFARGLSLEKLIWVLFLCAFIGDLIETGYVFLTAGILMRRSSLVLGPFSIVWGLGAVVLTVLLSRMEKRGAFPIFLLGFFFGGAFEYLCSVFTEVVFGMKFWDYSGMPFNIDGRTNLLFMLFWGLLSLLWLRFAYPPLSSWIERIPPLIGLILSWCIVLFLSCDMLVTAAVMLRAVDRKREPKARNVAEEFIDEFYPESRIERLWPNMKFLSESS